METAVSATNKAANVIPRFELGPYISSPLVKSATRGAPPIASVRMLIEQLNKENDSGHS